MRHAAAASVALAAGLLLAVGCSKPDTPRVTSPTPSSSGSPGASARPASGASLEQGKKAFTEAGCSGCHRIGDLGGIVGPDLSHEGAAHTADWIVQQVRNPKSHEADGTMPACGKDRISDDQLKALAEYLASLK